MSRSRVQLSQHRGKRAFRAGGRGGDEAPRYPTHDTFDRRGFLARLGLGLLAAGAGCVDREVVPHGDFRTVREWSAGEWRCCDGTPHQPDAARDWVHVVDGTAQPPDAPRDLRVRDTAGTPDHPPSPLDGAAVDANAEQATADARSEGEAGPWLDGGDPDASHD